MLALATIGIGDYVLYHNTQESAYIGRVIEETKEGYLLEICIRGEKNVIEEVLEIEAETREVTKI